MNHRNQAGLTLVEALVVLGIVFILASLPISTGHGVTPSRARMTQALSNMKQLQMTCQQMALDGETTGDKTLNWPGTYATSADWIAKVVPGYLSTNDLCKLLSVPGLIVPPNKLPKINDTALRVYAVTEDSEGDIVMLSTANFTNTPAGGTLNTNSPPFGTNGFVVFRKGGDGAIYRQKDVGKTNLIGSFVSLCR